MCKGILFITISHIRPCLTHARNVHYLLYEMETVLVSQRVEHRNVSKKTKNTKQNTSAKENC